MSKPVLRIAPSTIDSRRERELDLISGLAKSKQVSVPLGMIVPLLIDAVENDRAWLNDFSDDLVRIDSDLYDVLLAYGDMSKRNAA